MTRILICVLLAVALASFTVGCKSKSGSREFIPGKGWIEN